MKILYTDLTKYKIEKLIINSLEQALYQAIVVIEGEEYVVWQDKKSTMRSHKLMQLTEAFETLDIPEVVLRHESPYDEMVGQPDKPNSNRMEVPLGLKKVTLPERLN